MSVTVARTMSDAVSRKAQAGPYVGQGRAIQVLRHDVTFE